MSAAAGLLIAVVATQTPLPGTLVERIVLVVGNQVITQSELEMEARIALALREGGDVAAGELPSDFLRGFRDYLINELVVAALARRMGALELPEEQIQRGMLAFAQAFRSERARHAFLQRYAIQPSFVEAVIRRNLRNERVLAERTRLRASTGGENPQQELEAWLAELRRGTDIRMPGPDGTLVRP